MLSQQQLTGSNRNLVGRNHHAVTVSPSRTSSKNLIHNKNSSNKLLKSPQASPRNIKRESPNFRESESSLNKSKTKVVKQNNFAPIKASDLIGVPTAVILPPVKKEERTVPLPSIQQIQKFQAMVYNKNYILNIDNQLTNTRTNHKYVNGYYNNLLEQKLPQTSKNNTHRTLDFISSVEQEFDQKNYKLKLQLSQLQSLHQETLFGGVSTTQDQTDRLAQALSISKDITLPYLSVDNSNYNNLNISMNLDAKAKAAKLIFDSEKKNFRDKKTKQIIGTEHFDPHFGNATPFKAVGTLEDSQFFKEDDLSQINNDDKSSNMDSTIFGDILRNKNLYKRQLQDEQARAEERFKMTSRKLSQEEMLDLDEDDPLYQSMLAKSSKYQQMSNVETPELNFLTARAKIKLRIMKKYQEDEHKKQQEAEHKAKQEADRLAQGGDSTNRQTSAQAKRKKHPPITRRRSFTECQLKYEEGLELYDPNNKVSNRLLTEKYTVDKIKLGGRFPIPEALINRPAHYWLKIDSLIHSMWALDMLSQEFASQPVDLKAPQNSPDEDDQLSIGESDSDENNAANATMGKTAFLLEKQAEKKKFDKTKIETQPFQYTGLSAYPYKAKEGAIPTQTLCVQRVDYINETRELMAENQKGDKKYTRDQLQDIFDYYCIQLKAQPVDMHQFYMMGDNSRIKFSIKNYTLDDNTAKALCMVIPYMIEIQELELMNNLLSDLMSGVILLAVFMNPTIMRFVYVGNSARNVFKNTFCALANKSPDKLKEINFMKSIPQIETLYQFTRNLTTYQDLIKVNLAGNAFSLNACRTFSTWLLKQNTLKDMNLASCKISNQGTRYIVDALNRNVTIRHLNFAYNDLSSSIYEFSIKIAAMLTRHPTILHCNIAQCGLKREEVMFIVIAMSTSKTFLSLHITANDLPYYERVFLRSIIAARIQNQNKNESMKKEIKFNKERYQVMAMAMGEHIQEDIKHYLNSFNQLEEQRQGLDFEIEDLIKEMDMERYFSKIPENIKIDQIQAGTKISILINKIQERQKELEKQQEAVKQVMNSTVPSLRSRIDGASGIDNKQKGSAVDQLDPNGNAFENQKQLKIDRQRQRAEIEATKVQKERSAGELALLFMGINQVAFELLIENPMTGYMNEIIFTRILGCDDIEQGNYWCDTTQCYICQKWEKTVIQVDPRSDNPKWAQKITQINHLKHTVEVLVHQADEAEQIKYEEMQQQLLNEQKQKLLRFHEENDSDQSSVAGALTTKFGDQNAKTQGLMFNGTINGAEKKHNNTSSAFGLKPVGSNDTQSRFGGTTGMTPKKTGQVSRTIGLQAIKEKPVDAFSNVESKVDDGALSKAIKEQLDPKIEPQVERQDTPVLKLTKPHKTDNNTSNPLAPVKFNAKTIQQHIFADKFLEAKDFEAMNIREERPETPPEEPVGHAQHDKYMHAKQTSRYGGVPNPAAGVGFGFGRGINKIGQTQKQPSIKELQNIAVNQNLPRAHSPAQSQQASVITSIQGFGAGKRKRGEPEKIQRTVFFQGMVYIIEEEVYSDSDNSSVYTSEDDFNEDNDLPRKIVDTVNNYNTWRQQEEERIAWELAHPALTEKQKRQQQMGIFEEPKVELTENQKEYRSKIWPKHYIPSLKEYKSEQLDRIGSELGIKIGGVKQFKRTYEDRGPEILSGPLANSKNIFLIASFNDWMPVLLKTKRELTFEKLNPEEPIPKATFVLDNHIKIFSNYVPPGTHYFYFVWQEGKIFLSASYDIARFKTTKIFLNRLTVKPRIYDFDTVHTVKGGDDEEAVFMKDRSVFKDFRDDNKQFLKKCFDQDIEFSKIIRVVKNDVDQFEDIKDILFKHYARLNNIFLYYIGISSFPVISMNDFTSWSNKCGFVDGKWINLATLDRILITTNVALHGLISSAERDLNRYEFLEIITRLATQLYRESKVCETVPQAIHKLLHDNIYPNSKEVNGEHFRRFHCYNVKVNEILKKNEVPLQKIYQSFTHSKKKYVTLAECREYIKKVALDVSEMQMGPIYAESMCTIIDTIRDRQRSDSMKYTEFLVFLCRIAYEHYRGTPYENEMLYLKLEKIIPKYLIVQNLTPLFLFEEEFEYKPLVKKKKVIKKKEVKKDSSESDKSETSEESEESSEEDLAECVILEEGKYQLNAVYMQKMAAEKIERAEKRRLKAEAKQEKERQKQEELEALALEEQGLSQGEDEYQA